MALHEQSVGATDEWYTPPHVFAALGHSFDMDVASPGRLVTPWIPAVTFLTANALSFAWAGFVWMNPPFGARNGLVPWLEKFFAHHNGIALVPERACLNGCGVVRITVHPPQGFPWVEWRTGDPGQSQQRWSGTPPCRPVAASSSNRPTHTGGSPCA
jgi:hypothetical protein